MLTFSPRYLLPTLLLFATEALIALYVRDQIIRPYIGDLLVVILIYCFVKSFLNTPVWPTAIAVLLFSYTIEVLQYFNLVHLLGLQDSKLARIVIGTSFAWTDLAAYTAGIAIVLFVEKK
ncbi:MAG: DUF2809 domain-containing protein [Bacteroidota bacterium]